MAFLQWRDTTVLMLKTLCQHLNHVPVSHAKQVPSDLVNQLTQYRTLLIKRGQETTSPSPESTSTNNASPVLHVYTDGSCLGNPGVGAFAFLFKTPQDDEAKYTYGHRIYGQTTNNRAELKAVIAALQHALEQKMSDISLVIHSDSKYVIEIARGAWRRRSNMDMWQEFDALKSRCTEHAIHLSFVWVRGHSDNIWNARVDALAQKITASLKKDIFKRK